MSFFPTKKVVVCQPYGGFWCSCSCSFFCGFYHPTIYQKKVAHSRQYLPFPFVLNLMKIAPTLDNLVISLACFYILFTCHIGRDAVKYEDQAGRTESCVAERLLTVGLL